MTPDMLSVIDEWVLRREIDVTSIYKYEIHKQCYVTMKEELGKNSEMTINADMEENRCLASDEDGTSVSYIDKDRLIGGLFAEVLSEHIDGYLPDVKKEVQEAYVSYTNDPNAKTNSQYELNKAIENFCLKNPEYKICTKSTTGRFLYSGN